MFWKHPSARSEFSETQYKTQTDVLNLHTDLLSARCTVDRLRTVVGPAFVAECADRKLLSEVKFNLRVVSGFLEQVENLLGPPDSVTARERARQ